MLLTSAIYNLYESAHITSKWLSKIIPSKVPESNSLKFTELERIEAGSRVGNLCLKYVLRNLVLLWFRILPLSRAELEACARSVEGLNWIVDKLLEWVRKLESSGSKKVVYPKPPNNTQNKVGLEHFWRTNCSRKVDVSLELRLQVPLVRFIVHVCQSRGRFAIDSIPSWLAYCECKAAGVWYSKN